VRDDGLLSEDDEISVQNYAASADGTRNSGKAVARSNRRLNDDDDPDNDDDDNDDDDDRYDPDDPGLDGRGSGGHTDTDDQDGDDPITLKDRQSLINVQHPFGLPIWKPALYKKSRSVTRYADEALHSVPSAQAERHLLPGNILWTLFFGWWLALVFISISALLYLVPRGGKSYSSLVFGLGWYLFWPFGKYVEGNFPEDEEQTAPEDEEQPHARDPASDSETVRAVPTDDEPDNAPTPRPRPNLTPSRTQSYSWDSQPVVTEVTALLTSHKRDSVPLGPSKSYGTISPSSSSGPLKQIPAGDFLGKAAFWLVLVAVIAPTMLFACIVCWALIIAIPMAKLNWALIKHLFQHPTGVRFCSAPSVVMLSPGQSSHVEGDDGVIPPPSFTVKRPRLSAGQLAPSGSPTATVLLCIYRAVGWKYYKYTVGGVNIIFINLVPIVFFVIFDGFILSPLVEHRESTGQHVPAVLVFLASHALIFLLSLLSVIPLSYFIGMAVASISAQSSIGMGAVINATFGSIIEILLYSIALTQGKGRLVEGSIVGSLLAGVLLMPGVSMCSSAVRRKEQKFNAKSAGVTSTMLIMAIIGTLTPTLFYQVYGNVSDMSVYLWNAQGVLISTSALQLI